MFSDSDFSSQGGPNLGGDESMAGFDGDFEASMQHRQSYRDSHRDSHRNPITESLMSALPLIEQPDMKNIENAFVMSLRAK